MGRGLGIEEECGGDGTTRVSMNHCHTPHTTHSPSGTEGEEFKREAQHREWQLKVCHWGRSWMRRRDLLIHQNWTDVSCDLSVFRRVKGWGH